MLWLPTDLGAGLALWLDADDASTITLNGSNVSQWSDKSGNNRHHVQANAANQPSLIAAAIGGKPAVQSATANRTVQIVDGNPTFGTTDLDAVAGDLHSLFCVMNGGNGTGILQPGSGRAGIGYSKGGGIGSGATYAIGLLTHAVDVPLTPPRWFVQQKGWIGVSGGGTVNVPTWHPGALNTNAVVGMVWDGTATTATLDGAPFANSGPPHTTANQQAPGRVAAASAAGGGNSQVGELIICDTALSTDDRQKLEGYLAHKWGLEANLPVDHPYKTTPPTVATPSLAVTDPDDEALASGGTYNGPTDIAFGADVGFQFTLTNDGDAANTLGTITVGTGYTIDAGDNPSGDTIAPAGTATLTIKPATGTAGAKSATVTIPSDDPDSPYTFTVTATVQEAIAVTTPVPATNVTFNNAAVGGTLTTVGDAPMYHHRDHAVYGAPLVAQLTDDYPAARSIRVHRASVWNGLDIVPMLDGSVLNFDIWFGNPASGGTKRTYSADNGSGSTDIFEGAIAGYRVAPWQSQVVGDRLVVFCSVYVNADTRGSRVAVVSAAMSDLQAGTSDPWTLHHVSNEHGSTADEIGGMWMSSEPIEYEGSQWVVICDYASNKTGGQTWILNIANDGTVGDMVRLYTTTAETNIHYHSGVLLYDGVKYTVMWHIGDGVIRTLHRSITSISDFADNATIDTGSGIGGLYRVKNASASDWGDTLVAAGPFLTGSGMTGNNSRSQNLFPLCVDPNNPAACIKGGDTDSGVFQRVTLDANGIAVNEMIFNPVSNHIPQAADAQSFYNSSFIADVSGQYIAALVSNEFDNTRPLASFSGVAYSTDGGATFGWAWRGTASGGVVQNGGVGVLRDGTIVVGSLDSTASVRVITPGSKISGKPLFVGYRPTNVLPDLDLYANDGISASAASTVTAAHDGGTEKPLPSIVHSQNGFTLTRGFNDNSGVFDLFPSGAPSASIAASNMVLCAWQRKRTPDDNDEEWRIKDEIRHFLWTAGSWGGGNTSALPNVDGDSDDWVRVVMMYDGSRVVGTPTAMQLLIRGNAQNASASRCERFFESLVIDHDRPPLPYNAPDASGVSSGKIAGIGLGPTWTVIATMQIPEECWDSWTADEDGGWDGPVPCLSIADSDGTNAITVSGHLNTAASGGFGVDLTAADFDWEITDTESATPTAIADEPMRTAQVIIAISKDEDGAIQYAIAGPHGTTTGTRTMAVDVEADTIRFCNVAEDNALEMYVLSVGYDQVARSASELATLATQGGVPVAQRGGSFSSAFLLLINPKTSWRY